MNIGENIKNIRETRGISQKQLAKEVQVSQAMICQLERGSKTPNLLLSCELAKALSCEVKDFLYGFEK